MNFKNLKINYPLFLIIGFSTTMLIIGINKPFIGHHDWNGAFWGNVVRDYFTYINLENLSRPSLNQLIFSHYTPLLPTLFLISTILFGFHEYSMRLVPVIFSIIMQIFIFKTAKNLYGNLEGLITSLFVCVTPMFLYFGKLPDHEPIVISLIVITFYFFLLSNKKNFKLPFYIFLTLSLLESWPAFFLIPPLSIFAVLVKKTKIKKIIPIYVIAISVLILHFLSIVLVKGEAGLLQLINSGIERSIGQNLYFGETQYTFINFIKTESRYAVILFTRILILLSFFWLINFGINLKNKKIEKGDLLLLVLLIYPSLFIFSFSRLAFIHDYKLYHFLPFIAISSSVTFVRILHLTNKLLVKIDLKSPKFKTTIQILLAILIATSVLFERAPYLKALQNTSFNYPGFELGNIIKANTKPSDTVFINSLEHKAFFEVFTSYYAGKNLDYGSISLKDYLLNRDDFRKYNYFVIIKNRDYDNQLLEFLLNNKSKDFGNYILFSI